MAWNGRYTVVGMRIELFIVVSFLLRCYKDMEFILEKTNPLHVRNCKSSGPVLNKFFLFT